ncbi:Suppressor of Sensor Kinase (SLN1), partial [Coemansia sp. RSA 2049]
MNSVKPSAAPADAPAPVPPPELRSLKIKTDAVKRLIKERKIYFLEADQQRVRIEKLHQKESVHEADIRKQKEVLEETLGMIPYMERKIRAAMEDLDNIVTSLVTENEGTEFQEVMDANIVIRSAKEALNEIEAQKGEEKDKEEEENPSQENKEQDNHLVMGTDNCDSNGARHIEVSQDLSGLEFNKKLFYLHGYPNSLERTLDSHWVDRPDAQGEELRRRYKAKLKIEDGLAKLGARITVSAEEGRLADFIVVPDDAMLAAAKLQQHPGSILPSGPMLNETLLLKNIQGGGDASNPDLVTTLTEDNNGIDEADIDMESDSNSDYTYFDLDADEQRERTEWHRMLSAALTGDIVVGEKKRLNTQSDGYLFNLTDNEYAEHLSELLQNNDYRAVFKHLHMDIWLGCRAVLRGRTPQQEKKTLESLRAVHADTALRAVVEFNADHVVTSVGTSDDQPSTALNDFSTQCLLHTQKLLRRLNYVETMYPNLKALNEAKPLYASKEFQDRLAAITSWTNISMRLGALYKMLQRWTGSQDLNLYST